MNKIKALFISTFIGLAVIVIVLAVAQFFQDGLGLAWMGALLTGFLIVEFFVSLFRFKTTRTPAKLPLLTTLIAVATAVAQVRFQLFPSSLSLLLLAGWLAYVYWYSRLDRGQNEQLAVGRPFPTITLEDEAGNKVSSADFAGQTTLYLFYRGNWCPLCMAQIKEVAAQYQELAQRGVQVVLVSPQPHKFTRNLAARFDIPFTFLVDAGNKAARQLGIDQKNGVPAGMELLGYDSDTVMPTVLIVGEDGRILYADLTDSYRIRPEPAEFLRVLDNLAATKPGRARAKKVFIKDYAD
ncbi:Alkyl hydroperoxide reductase subunit C-like protein [hydrothermal vent metagenome]|uniref:thioredoxin-dependent peroxiredoxin n=1 Tax=hydrothermal vent metagenome TaxID=652676 RepID=A0A3B0W127_9ZZZZ